jgi:signal transduction histidine kinase
MTERSRVAQELHDTLLQSVSGTAMEIQGASRLLSLGSTELAHQQLSMALEGLGNSMAEARQAIWDLKCPEPCELGLDRALAAAAKRKCAGGPQLSWSISGRPRSLSQNIERHIFRIGMEAITNAIRHSDCSHISVALDYREDSIALVITDNGRGFNCSLAESASQSNHWGLAGMKDRAKQCSGELTILSFPGEGTSVGFEALLPVSP